MMMCLFLFSISWTTNASMKWEPKKDSTSRGRHKPKLRPFQESLPLACCEILINLLLLSGPVYATSRLDYMVAVSFLTLIFHLPVTQMGLGETLVLSEIPFTEPHSPCTPSLGTQQSLWPTVTTQAGWGWDGYSKWAFSSYVKVSQRCFTCMFPHIRFLCKVRFEDKNWLLGKTSLSKSLIKSYFLISLLWNLSPRG